MPHWFTFWKLIFRFSITGKKHSFPWPKDLNEVYVNLLNFFTFPSLRPKQFGGIAHVSGFKSEWHENFDGFHKTTCGFLSNPKAKIADFGDQQASKIRVHKKKFHQMYSGNQLERPGHPGWNAWEPEGLREIFIRATNFEVWAPKLKCLGARRAPWNFP